MFVNMAFVSPKPGKEKAMTETMRSFAKALDGMPGLLETFVLSEEGEKNLVGVSMWRDRMAFEAAMGRVHPPPPPEPLEQMRETTTIRQFESI